MLLTLPGVSSPLDLEPCPRHVQRKGDALQHSTIESANTTQHNTTQHNNNSIRIGEHLQM